MRTLKGLSVKRTDRIRRWCQIRVIPAAERTHACFGPSLWTGICKCSCMWIRGGRTECVSVCLFLSFPSMKQSLFYSPGFKRNLVPGSGPTLTLTLSLCCSMAPIVVSRDLFHNHQPQIKFHTALLLCKYFFTALLSVSLSLSIFSFKFVSKFRAARRQPRTIC